MSVTISKTVRSYPKLPYEGIARDILGRHYKLSLVFVGGTRAQTLNKRYRKKTYVPNVLSFNLGSNAGEIYITPEVAKREAKKTNLNTRTYIGFLFIHGILHLKGHTHGATMERAEKKYLARYNLE